MTTSTWLAALAEIYPPDRLLTQPAQVTPYESDALTAYRQRPAAVVIPETQDEVIETVRLCHRYGVPFVARGSGTSLSGGSLPIEDGLLITLNRLNRIVQLDPEERIAVVEPGAINLDVTRPPPRTASTSRPIPPASRSAPSAATSRSTPAARTA